MKGNKNIRIGVGLLELLDRAARHSDMDCAMICRAAARRLVKGSATVAPDGGGGAYSVAITTESGKVVHFEIEKMYHRPGPVSYRIRGHVDPGVPPSQYRAAIAAQCMLGLNSPKYAPPDIPGDYKLVKEP